MKLTRVSISISLASLMVILGAKIWFEISERKAIPRGPVTESAPFSEVLQKRLETAWNEELAALGANASNAQRTATARRFSEVHASEIAERDRLVATQASAPYIAEMQAMSQEISTKAVEYAEVGRKLRSGELTELPADLAPPPLPNATPSPINP